MLLHKSRSFHSPAHYQQQCQNQQSSRRNHLNKANREPRTQKVKQVLVHFCHYKLPIPDQFDGDNVQHSDVTEQIKHHLEKDLVG